MSGGDKILRKALNAEGHDLRIPLGDKDGAFSLMKGFAPVQIKNAQGEVVLVPPHQERGVDSFFFLQTFTPRITAATDGTLWRQYGVQDSATMILQYEITELPRTPIVELSIQWEYTAPTGATNCYAAGPNWIDRVEFSMDGSSQPFQKLYGDLILRFMIMSLPPEKLFQYALDSGMWINNNNFGDQTRAYNDDETTQHNNYANCIHRFTPAQTNSPATTKTELIDNAGDFGVIAFPLIGSFVQQAGVFPCEWIEGGRFYVSVFGECPGLQFQTDQAATHPASKNVATRSLLVAKCFSAPDDDRWLNMISNVNEVRKRSGIHIQYMDYMRTTVAVSGGLVASTTYNLSLNQFTGRHLVAIIAIGRPAKTQSAAAGGAQWKYGVTMNTYYPTLANDANYVSTSPFTTALGVEADTGLPSYDLVNAYNEPLFVSGLSQMTQRENVKYLVGPKLVNNPLTLGLLPGGKGYAPFAFADLWVLIGNPLKAIQGIYDGALELELNSSLRIKTSTSPNAGIIQYDIYGLAWGCLHIDKFGGRMRTETDPPARK